MVHTANSPRFYFLVMLLLITGNLSNAQESLLDETITLEKQYGTIAEFLTKVESAGNLFISYGNNTVPSSNYIQIEGGNKKIREFLDEILAGIPVTYSVKMRRISLVPGPLFQTLRGNVKDIESGSPLIGANLRILEAGTLEGVISDTNGNFHFKNVPVGRHNIYVTYMGYKGASFYDILVGSGKEVYLDVSMKENFIEIPEVRQHGNRKGDPKNDMATVSARSFTVEETRRYPAAVNDPARMALVLPGVTRGDNDLFNEMVIRGHTPSSVLWRIEGVEILTPNHFSLERSSTGWINAISSNLLGRSDFLTGAFPAEYGNSLGGIFDISLRNGNNRKREYSAQVGMLGIDLSAEGPLSNNYDGSYLVNFRYAITALNSRIGSGFDEEEVIPRYSDLCFKIHLPTQKSGKFSLWGLLGRGWANNDNTKDARGMSNSTRSQMTTVGLTHLYFPNNKSYLKSVIAFSMNNTNLDKGVKNTTWMAVESWDFNLSALRASLLYRYKFTTKLSVKMGGVLSHMMYDYLQWGPYHGRVNSAGNTNTFQGYAQAKYSLAQDLFLTAGFHFSHFDLNAHSSFEPRLGLKWDFAEEQSFGIGIGKHSQQDFISSYFQEAQRLDGSYTMPNRDLGLTKANHYIFSYQNSLIKNVHIKTELYYQDLYNIPIAESPVYMKAPVNYEYPMDTLVNSGTGRNYGLEVTVEKYFSRGYYFLISSSLYDSKIDPGNGTLYNTRYNAGFSQTVVGGKEFKIGRSKQDLLGVNAKVIWTGGNRGQSYDTAFYPPRMIFPKRFEEQFRDYFRLDVNFSYRINRPGLSHIFSFDIQNVTNKKNILRIDWDFAEEKFKETYQYGIFPFLSYKVEF